MSTVEEAPIERVQPRPKGCNADWCAKYRKTEKGKAAIARAAASRRERRLAAKAAKLAAIKLA